MKFKVKSSDFQKAISSVEGVITVREIKSLLSNVKIEAEKNNQLKLSATDLEISIKTTLECETIKKGIISLPAKQLNNTFKNINFANANFELDTEVPTQVNITDADGVVDFKMNINGIDGEEIKTISEIDHSDVVDLPCSVFSEMIKKTNSFVALEDTRFVFNGLFIKNQDKKVSIVGTDGRRLAKIDREINSNLPFSKGIIVPHKAVREISKMLDSNETGKIGFIENQVYLSIGHAELMCKLIDGNFPDYEAVIPKSSTYSVNIDKDKFNVTLKQALIAAEEPSKQIRLKFLKNILNVNSSTPGSTEVNINIPIDYTGEEVTIGFKGDYLVDLIRSINDSNIIMEFSSSNSPAVFKDPSDPDFISVIMPMKL